MHKAKNSLGECGLRTRSRKEERGGAHLSRTMEVVSTASASSSSAAWKAVSRESLMKWRNVLCLTHTHAHTHTYACFYFLHAHKRVCTHTHTYTDIHVNAQYWLDMTMFFTIQQMWVFALVTEPYKCCLLNIPDVSYLAFPSRLSLWKWTDSVPQDGIVAL